jgi:hypothetical protein
MNDKKEKANRTFETLVHGPCPCMSKLINDEMVNILGFAYIWNPSFRICHNYLALPLYHKSNYRQYTNDKYGVNSASAVCDQKTSKFLCPTGKNPLQGTWV